MVIGDKALTLAWKDHFSHVIDLGQAWFDMTGLPFVFAARGNEKLGLPKDLIGQYYKLLCCDMDDARVQGMQLFFDSLFSQGLLPHKVTIRFFDRP